MQTRRSVLRLGGLAAAAVFGRRLYGKSSTSGAPLRTVAYSDVTLHDGPMLEQFRAQHATLLRMDEDALLKPFRAAAGLPAPGVDLGGWYNASASFNPPADMHGFIPGHSLGQYISSLARAYAITGDAQTKAKVRRLVAGLAPTLTSRFYDGYPLPAYTFDKINIGLIDAHAFAGDPQALATLNRALDAALPHLPEKALTRPEMAQRPHPNVAFTWDESYTLPENLYLAWARGAGDRYRTLARRFRLDHDYFDPLALGENVLPGRHAYSHVNAFSSALQAYIVDGDPKYLAAARNGFDFVLAQSFATGGWGPNEAFVVPGSGKLGDSLASTHASFETPCGAYGHFKAARTLLTLTGESRYGDSLERVLYNTVLGALPMKPDGTAFYYSDYSGNGSKKYFEYACPCCSGTLGQVVADYSLSTYFRSDRGIAVNLYTPSSVRWRQSGRTITLDQSTRYPLDSDIELTVRTPTAEPFTVALRIPAWAGNGSAAAINGKRVTEPLSPGKFLELSRTWKDGDRITLALEQPLRLEAVDDQHRDLVAVMQGPLALFAVGEHVPTFKRDELLRAAATQLFQPFFAIGTGTTTRLYQTVT